MTHHSHSHSAPAELDVRVLLANAAKSAPGSPKAATGSSKLGTPSAQDGQGNLKSAQDHPMANSAERDAATGDSPAVAVVENLNHLLRIFSGELSAERTSGTPKGLEAAAMSAADREAIGNLAKSLGSRGDLQQDLKHAFTASLTAPQLSRTSPAGRLGSLPQEDDTASIASAPSTMENLHTASSGNGLDQAAPARPGTSSHVSHYVSMIEARNLMISMPAWDRPILRHNSTDLVLRFLNRHRSARHARSASPEQPSADAALSDSENSSDSEDDAEPDPLEEDRPSAISSTIAVSTPPRRLSPPRSRRQSPPRSLERVLSGALKPSPLGDTSRAALAASKVCACGLLSGLMLWIHFLCGSQKHDEVLLTANHSGARCLLPLTFADMDRSSVLWLAVLNLSSCSNYQGMHNFERVTIWPLGTSSQDMTPFAEHS